MEFPLIEPAVVRDSLDVARLVSYLRQESRTRPVVILTVAPGQAVPFVSPLAVVKAGDNQVDVVSLPTDELTRALTARLEVPQAGVYQGACRVYPPGTGWETNPYGVPLRMARTPKEVAELPGLLLDDVKRAVNARHNRALAQGPQSGVASAAPSAPEVAGVPRPTVPAEAPDEIVNAGDAEALARHLRHPSRRQPSVVVSRAAGTDEAYVDVDQLRTDLAGLARVFEIVSLEASWAFSRAVPDMCQVYGGASRVYPIGTEWENDPYRSPLRFAYGRVDRVLVTRQLVSDAMSMASAGSLELLPAATSTRVPVIGEVEGVAGERALVNLPGQYLGVVWPELVEPKLAAERLFTKKMQVQGVLDPDSRRIDVRDMRRSPVEATSGYRPGDTILVRVKDVAADSCTVEPFPGLSKVIPAADVALETDDLRDLMASDDVVPVLLVARDDATDEWLLSMAEAADAEDAVPSPSILVGGPPWLIPGSPLANPVEAQASTFEPESTPQHKPEASSAVVEALQAEKAQLVRALHTRDIEIRALRDRLEAARAQRLNAVRRKSRGSGHLIDDTHLFANEREQLDFEIRLAWARMTQPSEKPDLPLRPWRYSTQFFKTIHDVQGVSRDKIVEVIVHVLTGRDAELTSRELHQLRSGKGAEDAPVVRSGGETCWRVSLQTNTPSARRLHYWMCADGSIELSSVRLHDVFQP